MAAQFFILRVDAVVLRHLANLFSRSFLCKGHKFLILAPAFDFLLQFHVVMIFIGFILSFADYLMMPPNPPVAVIFACCATPSPKFRVENAVSPSGIIHAAKSGTRFRHLRATIEAAIR